MTAAKKMTQTRRKSEKVTPEASGTTTGAAETTTTAFDFEDFAKSNQEAVQAMLMANQAMLNGWTAFNQEVMAFADHRLRAELGRTESLIGCNSPEEAVQLQASFVQAAGEDYLREAQKLMGMMMDISRDCWAPVEERTLQTMKAFGQR